MMAAADSILMGITLIVVGDGLSRHMSDGPEGQLYGGRAVDAYGNRNVLFQERRINEGD